MADQAKATIRRLRNGIVGADSMETLSVGYTTLRDTVLDGIVRLGTERRVPPLLVRGEWGTGKSHFTRFVRASARALGAATGLVNLNARSSALNYPQRFYPSLVANCEAGERPSGLRQVINSLLVDKKGRTSLENFAARTPGDIARSILWLSREYEGDEDSLDLSTLEHPAWTTILGGDLAWASYGYKRAHALRRIADVAKLFRSIGNSGLIVIFDEVETIDQLWNIRSRAGAYTTLGELASMDHVWAIFAVTARFDAMIERDIAAGILAQNVLPDPATRLLRSVHHDTIDSVTPPLFDRKNASELANRVVRLYGQAHGVRAHEASRLASVVDDWSRDPRRNPRTLIRAIVDHLDRLRPVTRIS